MPMEVGVSGRHYLPFPCQSRVAAVHHYQMFARREVLRLAHDVLRPRETRIPRVTLSIPRSLPPLADRAGINLCERRNTLKVLNGFVSAERRSASTCTRLVRR
jgi:hypothetical protein